MSEQNCKKEIPAFVRNKYFYGKLLTVRDFNLEQEYFLNKIRFANKMLHGYGTVCGLEASIVVADENKLEISLTKGVAIDCCGNEITVIENNPVEVENWDKVDKNKPIYIYLKYSECETEPVASISSSSTCEEECCNSRIKETFSLYATNDEPELDTVFTVVSHKDNTTDILNEIKEKFYENKKTKCSDCQEEGVLITVLTKSGNSFQIDKIKETELRPLIFTNPMLRDLIISHKSDFDNPHKTTAEQIGALKTINGIGNTEENKTTNVNIVSNDATIEIEGNIEENEIDLKLSPTLQNQILDIQRYLKKLETVFMYIRERALKCTVINFKLAGKEFKNKIALEISKEAKKAVDEKIYENEELFFEILKSLSKKEMDLVNSLEGSVTEKSLKELSITIEELIENLNNEDILKTATLQDEVCFYLLQLEKIKEEETICEKTLNCIEVAFRNVSIKFGSQTAKQIERKIAEGLDNKICKDENKTIQLIKSLAFKNVLKEIKETTTAKSFKNLKNAVNQLDTALSEGTFEAILNTLSNICNTASKLEKIKSVTVPELVGKNVNEAKKIITEAGLLVGNISNKVDLTKPIGTVLSQNPKAGMKVKPNTPVNLVTSKKLEVITPPINLGGTVIGGGTVFTPKKLTDVPGIGSTTAKKLSNAGIKTANELINKKPEDIATILGITTKKAEKLINNAKKIL